MTAIAILILILFVANIVCATISYCYRFIDIMLINIISVILTLIAFVMEVLCI